ncbi:transposon Tf2-9 polyprotein [Nephila pilipes]|uniref:Transposon Tf2-9 polyprotein n=1 Tax=Nephila pilipes TaxID=299642 RepID=A0A8X6MJD0_NEPPI|nr:transposon Tf2-9 polyprotein [Nephila pilipes]
MGIKDSGQQERLLRENNLGLEKAIEIVRTAEESREQICYMKYETATVNFVKKKENPNQLKKSSLYECKKSGRKHKPRGCPAFGKICTKCNKKNHFAAKYFQNTKNIHEINVPENELDVYIDSVTLTETKCEIINCTDSIDKNIEMHRKVKELKNSPWPFYVVNVKSKLILGLKGCKELKLIERIDVIECSKIKKDGIVSKVNKSTYWVQSLVIVEKPNVNLRLRLDPRDLNKVIKREHYQIPCIDDIINKLEGYNEDSHNAIISKVLERARSLNKKFNPDKLQYRVGVVGTDVLELLYRWFIPEYDSLYDHRMISFELKIPSSDRACDCSAETNLFNTKRANWNLFYSHCSKAENAILDSLNNCILPVSLELCVQDVQDLIISAAEKSISLKKRGCHKVPWWSVELFCIHKQLNASRRRYQRTKSSVLREVYRKNYIQIKVKYKFKLDESKANSWKSFLADITVQNVWKKIYTHGVKTNFTKRLEISGIEVSSGHFTSSFEDTIDAILRKSFPRDPNSQDNSQHRVLRSEADLVYESDDDIPFSRTEIDCVIDNLNQRINLKLGGVTIEEVHKIKYLGIIVDNKMQWKEHISYVSSKSEKILLGLLIISHNTFGVKTNVLQLIYKQGIVPLMSYASRAWGHSLRKKVNSRLIRRTQRRFLLRVIKGYKTLSYEAVFAISGMPPIDLAILNNLDVRESFLSTSLGTLDEAIPISLLPHLHAESLSLL